ncbi:hypothetical protein STIAU_1373 [Stigmatella aurantiaca DW4/3-1]|uniref:Uncharacterized protein n=1 Tax=Stigmatella aurantiaca (strain DW4/3-1) TaxID=378806 RepID=Q08QB6_STIAD|nr:hypothetical protein STIAU_1373 [Stigmatella aurantiaca DW4/3-1]
MRERYRVHLELGSPKSKGSGISTSVPDPLVDEPLAL